MGVLLGGPEAGRGRSRSLCRVRCSLCQAKLKSNLQRKWTWATEALTSRSNTLSHFLLTHTEWDDKTEVCVVCSVNAL